LPAEFFSLIAEAQNYYPPEFYEPRYLRLAFNKLSGTIPTEVGTVVLAELELQNNTLVGTIPTQIGDSSSSTLAELRLSNNQLIGNIPSELGFLHILRLNLNDNQLEGTIPTELFDTGTNPNQFFYEIYLNNNSLTGPIPSEIGNLQWTNELDFSHNFLSGEIPTQFGMIGDHTPYLIDLSNNDLDGTFPTELGRLKDIVEFYINNNNLGGSLPSEFGQLSQIPDFRFFSPSVVLDVSDNNFIGQPPRMVRVSREETSYTFSMIADNNQFSGRLSETYCSEREDSDDEEILSFIGSQFNCPLPFCCDDPGNNCGDPCIERNNDDDDNDENDNDDEDDNISSGNYPHSYSHLLALLVAFNLFLFGF